MCCPCCKQIVGHFNGCHLFGKSVEDVNSLICDYNKAINHAKQKCFGITETILMSDDLDNEEKIQKSLVHVHNMNLILRNKHISLFGFDPGKYALLPVIEEVQSDEF